MSSLVFEDELYDMTETVIPFLADYFNASYVSEEFPIRSYRTDLVFIQVNFDAIYERLEKFGHLEPILKNNRQKVYNWVKNNGPVTKEEFMDDGPYAESYKSSLLKWLLQRGYIQEVEHENALPEEWPIQSQGQVLYEAVEIPFHSTIFAVELKQKNWEYAIEQANRAYEYADFWYVCMDEGGLPTEEQARAELDEYGAGMLSADRDGVYELDWTSPPSNRYDTNYHQWYTPDDMGDIGQKQRWRLNEESLEHIRTQVKTSGERFVSVSVDERVKTETSD